MFNQMLLQRYMPGTRTLQMLDDDGLYLRRVDGYPDDPTEGNREYFGRNENLIVESLNRQVPEDLRMSIEQARELSKGLMVRDKEVQFIQSWFWHTGMSRLMWDNYGQFSKNPDCALVVVNRFTLGAYLDEILPIGYRFESVKYVEDKQLHKEAFFTKHMEFEPESEYRLSINVGELSFFNPAILPEYHWLSRRPAGSPLSEGGHYRNNGVACEHLFRAVDEYGFILKAPLANLIEAVYVPNQATEAFVSQLDERLAGKGCAARCQRVVLPPKEQPAADKLL